MGDRTYTSITVRRSDFERHKDFLADSDKTYADELENEEDNPVVRLIEYECNYAEWNVVEDYLKEHQIEYDKSWEDGSEYDGGSLHARWVSGKYEISELSRTGDTILEELKKLQEAFRDPKKLVEMLQKRILELEPFEIRDIAEPPSNAARFIEEVTKKKASKKGGSK